MNLRIVTWNINSLRLRLPLLKELVAALQPDVICLQETKVPDELFPAEQARIVRQLVSRVEIQSDAVRLHVNLEGLGNLATELNALATSAARSVT